MHFFRLLAVCCPGHKVHEVKLASGLGLIEIGLLASNIYSAHDINYIHNTAINSHFMLCIGCLLKTMF